VDERTLREVYLPHYRKAVQKASVASVMTSYNKVNGTYASENKHLLRDILKGEWGFDGFVMSDWLDGVASTVGAANNGLDVEMPIANHFKRSKLKGAIAKGDISEATIDDSIRRVLRRKFEWGHFDGTKNVPGSVIKSPEHRELALEADREGMTLLKNADNALPLDRSAARNVVVLGYSADDVRLGDLGSSRVQDDGEDAVSPLQGIIGAAQTVNVHYYADLSTDKAQEATSSADAVVVIASLGPKDEGEWIRQYEYIYPGRGGDRRDLSLHAEDVALIKRAAASNRRVIVVIQAGSAVTVADWVDDVEAVLMAWYPGVKGGIAIGETLFGDSNPSGKTPVSWPVSEEQLYEFGSLERQRVQPVLERRLRGVPVVFEFLGQAECLGVSRPVGAERPGAAEQLGTELEWHVRGKPGAPVPLVAYNAEEGRLHRDLLPDCFERGLHIGVEAVPDVTEINAVVRLVPGILSGASTGAGVAGRVAARDPVVEFEQVLDVAVLESRSGGKHQSAGAPVPAAGQVGCAGGGGRRGRLDPLSVRDVTVGQVRAGRVIDRIGPGQATAQYRACK